MRGIFITNATDDAGRAFIKRLTLGDNAQDIYEVSMESAAALIDEERRFDESEFIDGGVDQGRIGRIYIAQIILGVDTKTLKRALSSHYNITDKESNEQRAEGSPLTLPFSNKPCQISKAQTDQALSDKTTQSKSVIENSFDTSDPQRTHMQNMALLRKKIEAVAKSLDTTSEVALCGVQKVLDRGLKYMSTGEIKRVMLCSALLSKRRLLILSDAWSGLDAKTKEIFGNYFNSWVAIDTNAPLMSGEELLAFCATVKTLADEVNSVMGLDFHSLANGDYPLIEMHKVNVGWDGKLVLRNLEWSVRRGEHTLITGPNGSGKTTLLELITGDNMQVFCNDIKIFGRTRGVQLDKWTLKRALGIVSYRLHVEYTLIGGISVEDVVVSGFHDSIGLYEATSASEHKATRQWLHLAKMEELANTNFASLSYGEQRMVLILRAAVKNPPLLILDEPCHALDAKSRLLVSKLLETIGALGTSTLLHVTHEKDEILDCEKKVLELCPEEEPMYKEYERHSR